MRNIQKNNFSGLKKYRRKWKINMSKHILFIFRNMGTGGAQKIEAFVANTLINNGYKVTVLNMAKERCSVAIDKEIPVYNLFFDNVENEKNSIKRAAKKIAYLIQLRKAIKKIKPDLICVFLSDIVRLTVLAMWGTKIPIIGSERGDPYQFSPKKLKQYNWAYNQCDGVAFQLKKAEKAYSLKRNIKKVIIENPCIPREESFPERTGNEHIILTAGRLAKQKRFDVLIDAFSIVYKTHPEYKMFIYGDGPLKDELKQQIRKRKLEQSVVLVGNVKDVFREATSAEFFVLSSDFEGIPNVLMEAMAIGFPCISTDCSPGGAEMLLQGGKRGIIVPREDSIKMAEAMIRYIEHPELQKKYSQRAKEIIEEYSPERIQEKWLDFFKDFI